MIQGLLSINQVFQPSKCQIVSARLCSPNFPVPASAFMGIQPVAGEIRSPEPNLLSQFSHFLTLIGIEYPLKALKSCTQLFPSESLCWSSTHLLPVAQLALSLTPGPCTTWFIHQLHCSEVFVFVFFLFFFFSWTEQRKIVQAS